ncbi:hypothetical protein D3879_25765 [Pseudomonas cavernicola]|uniref:5-bromo-4-chloroindolyl phosphate hydrolysis protein n=1 Tax=Pseudomonas cavernicola TaxID=2320866 RepID=A0A418X9P8_9PSED|nr:5-bromo-4-chloroindolyl phosphate hydrolysis family protein [Pseudomonas cavernicola]RJG09202.1 hypothetical protein D3879_25765 [Pseudomonas cavernicola]
MSDTSKPAHGLPFLRTLWVWLKGAVATSCCIGSGAFAGVLLNRLLSPAAAATKANLSTGMLLTASLLWLMLPVFSAFFAANLHFRHYYATRPLYPGLFLFVVAMVIESYHSGEGQWLLNLSVLGSLGWSLLAYLNTATPRAQELMRRIYAPSPELLDWVKTNQTHSSGGFSKLWAAWHKISWGKSATETAAKEAGNDLVQVFRREVNNLRQLSEALNSPHIGDECEALLRHCTAISALIEQEPGRLGQLQRFMAYHLPTASRLVGYFDKAQLLTESSAQKAQHLQEIEVSLQTLVVHFEQVHNQLVSSDLNDLNIELKLLKDDLAQQSTGKLG